MPSTPKESLRYIEAMFLWTAASVNLKTNILLILNICILWLINPPMQSKLMYLVENSFYYRYKLKNIWFDEFWPMHACVCVQVVMQVVRMLPDGHRVKREVDVALDVVSETMTPMHYHLREIIISTYRQVKCDIYSKFYVIHLTIFLCFAWINFSRKSQL